MQHAEEAWRGRPTEGGQRGRQGSVHLSAAEQERRETDLGKRPVGAELDRELEILDGARAPERKRAFPRVRRARPSTARSPCERARSIIASSSPRYATRTPCVRPGSSTRSPTTGSPQTVRPRSHVRNRSSAFNASDSGAAVVALRRARWCSTRTVPADVARAAATSSTSKSIHSRSNRTATSPSLSWPSPARSARTFCSGEERRARLAFVLRHLDEPAAPSEHIHRQVPRDRDEPGRHRRTRVGGRLGKRAEEGLLHHVVRIGGPDQPGRDCGEHPLVLDELHGHRYPDGPRRARATLFRSVG